MKLHEVETIDENAAYVAYRRAVPGGWLYCERVIGAAGQSIACERVPDPTAEHVTHGAVNVAAMAGAEAGYTKAVADCWQVANEWAKGFGAPMLERARLIDALKELRFNGSTSQTGEG